MDVGGGAYALSPDWGTTGSPCPRSVDRQHIQTLQYLHPEGLRGDRPNNWKELA